MNGWVRSALCGVWIGGLSLACESAPEARPAPTSPPAAAASLPVAPATKNSWTDDPAAALPSPHVRGDEFRRGVSLGLFVSTRDEEARRGFYSRFLDEIVQVGATDLQLVVQWAQADVRSSEVWRDPNSSTDDALLIWVIEQARSRGLRVFVMPIIDLQKRAPGDWRGKLAAGDWDAWWTSYSAYIGHYARLSQAHGVSLFSVGSELVSTELEQGRWRALIAQVRGMFDGELTYSANWDHFRPVPFWDALDVAGVTGYGTLSLERDPDEQALLRGFDAMRREVDAWTAATGKRFMFTEIGYASQVGGARDPWDYRPRPGGADAALQLRCYRAMYRAWHDHPALAGLFIWNWFGMAGVDSSGYTPRGKPAASVLRHWYTASAAAAGEVEAGAAPVP